MLILIQFALTASAVLDFATDVDIAPIVCNIKAVENRFVH
jgi:hypothetical protein